MNVGAHDMHGEKTNEYRVLLENLTERDCLYDLGIDGSIILELILKKYVGRAWNWLRTKTNDEHSNDPQISCWEFLDHLWTSYLLKSDFATWNYLGEVLTIEGIEVMLLWNHTARQLSSQL